MKRLVLLLVLSGCLLAEALAVEAPLANAGRKGLQAKTIDEMLALPDEEIDIGLGALLIGKEYDLNLDVPKYLARLDQMALELRSRIGKQTQPRKVLSVMSSYICKNRRYTPVKDEEAVGEDSMLHCVLARTKGTCVGLTTLYLALAERLGVPLFGACAPHHAFVRYRSDGTAINIEPVRKGDTFPHSAYIKTFFGGRAPDEDSFYMRNLGKREFLGILLNDLGAAYSNQGKVEQAISARKRAISVNPTFADPWISLGAHLRQRNPDEAVEAFKKGLVSNPHDGQGWFLLGYIYWDQDKLDEAIEAWKKAAAAKAAKTELAGAWLALGNAYHRQGKRDEAIQAFRKCLEIDPQRASVWYALGVSFLDAGSVAEAIGALKKAAAIEPKYVEAWLMLGVAYSDQSRLKEAIKAWGEAVAIDPQCARGWYNLGNAYREQKELRRAIRAYEKALEIDPRYTEAWNNLGVTYADQNNDDAAIRAFKKALDLNPEHANAWYGLGVIYYCAGDYRSAQEHLRKAQQLGHEAARELLEKVEANLKEPQG